MTALSEFVDDWEWTPGTTFPEELRNQSNFYTLYESYGVRAAVESVVGSITYMTYSGKLFKKILEKMY